MWDDIQQHIRDVTGTGFTLGDRQSVGGGSINQAYQISDTHHQYFVKLNQASKVAMFEAEARGLEDITQTHSIRVPKPLCWGSTSGHSYIVLEWLDLGYGNTQSWDIMGRQLAAMHQTVSTQGFGWCQNNTIGATPQLNPWTQDWGTFFTEHRIGYQLKLAQRRGRQFSRASRLLEIIPQRLSHQPQPSLVHGDLWSGNAMVTTTGKPIILDPAVYYGDREVDIAMSELFGGFPPAFYQGYQAVFPLEQGYKQRKTLYNLYHILNHFNLFGGSYASQAERMIDQVLA